MAAFATDSCKVIDHTVLLEANRSKLQATVVNGGRDYVGCGTAIHSNVIVRNQPWKR